MQHLIDAGILYRNDCFIGGNEREKILKHVSFYAGHITGNQKNNRVRCRDDTGMQSSDRACSCSDVRDTANVWDIAESCTLAAITGDKQYFITQGSKNSYLSVEEAFRVPGQEVLLSPTEPFRLSTNQDKAGYLFF